MPTMKDIAKYTGLSHGTVSNVLNEKGNVSVEKINLVKEAAQKLGYSINAQAKQLRQGHSKRVCVVIPRGDIKRYNDLFDGINREFRKNGYDVEAYFTDDSAYEEERLMEQIATIKPLAVVLVSSSINNVNIFSEDIPFIFVERNIENLLKNTLYVGFDYYKAGKEIAEKCVSNGMKKIAIFSDSKKFSNTKFFLNGIMEVLDKNNYEYKYFQSYNVMKLESAFKIFGNEERYDSIISDSIEKAEILKTVSNFINNGSQPIIYTLANKGINLDTSVYRYELNYKLCGRKIAKYILEKEESNSTIVETIEIENDGFKEDSITLKDKKNTTLNFLSLISPTTNALKYLLSDFKRKTGIDVKLIGVTYDELNRFISNMIDDGENPYDLIRIDMNWLNWCAEKLFKPIDMGKNPYKKIKNNFSEIFKNEYFKVKGINYALPLDPSVQILYYRKDLFDNALISREFYERYKRKLSVPKNYKEYDRVSEFFTKKYNINSPTRYGTSLSYATPLVAVCDFLLRWRETGASIVNDEGRIIVNSEEMKKTLEEYINSLEYSDKKFHKWWNQGVELFSEGKSAMNIVFSNHASAIVLNNNSNIESKVGFAAVPGRNPMLGGGVIGITKETKKIEEIELFLQWIYSENIATAVTSLGGYINHKNIVNNQDILQSFPWIEGMEKSFSIGKRKSFDNSIVKIDGITFEEILGKAILDASLGLQTVDEALNSAQKKISRYY